MTEQEIKPRNALGEVIESYRGWKFSAVGSQLRAEHRHYRIYWLLGTLGEDILTTPKRLIDILSGHRSLADVLCSLGATKKSAPQRRKQAPADEQQADTGT